MYTAVKEHDTNIFAALNNDINLSVISQKFSDAQVVANMETAASKVAYTASTYEEVLNAALAEIPPGSSGLANIASNIASNAFDVAQAMKQPDEEIALGNGLDSNGINRQNVRDLAKALDMGEKEAYEKVHKGLQRYGYESMDGLGGVHPELTMYDENGQPIATVASNKETTAFAMGDAENRRKTFENVSVNVDVGLDKPIEMPAAEQGTLSDMLYDALAGTAPKSLETHIQNHGVENTFFAILSQDKDLASKLLRHVTDVDGNSITADNAHELLQVFANRDAALYQATVGMDGQDSTYDKRDVDFANKITWLIDRNIKDNEAEVVGVLDSAAQDGTKHQSQYQKIDRSKQQSPNLSTVNRVEYNQYAQAQEVEQGQLLSPPQTGQGKEAAKEVQK